MSGSGKGLLGLWLYRSGEQEWALKEGSPLHRRKESLVNILYTFMFLYSNRMLSKQHYPFVC